MEITRKRINRGIRSNNLKYGWYVVKYPDFDDRHPGLLLDDRVHLSFMKLVPSSVEELFTFELSPVITPVFTSDGLFILVFILLFERFIYSWIVDGSFVIWIVTSIQPSLFTKHNIAKLFTFSRSLKISCHPPFTSHDIDFNVDQTR